MIVALSIVSLLTAIAVPALTRRLDAAFSAADAAQLNSSARLLPVRLATLGIELSLNQKTQATLLADGRPPLDLPAGWILDTDQPPYFGRAGACNEGQVTITDGNSGRRWRVSFAKVSCATSIVELHDSDS